MSVTSLDQKNPAEFYQRRVLEEASAALDPTSRGIKFATIFMPEFGPLAPGLAEASATFAKVHAAVAPAAARIEAHEAAFLETGEAIEQLRPLLPEIGRALETFNKAASIFDAYLKKAMS